MNLTFTAKDGALDRYESGAAGFNLAEPRQT